MKVIVLESRMMGIESSLYHPEGKPTDKNSIKRLTANYIKTICFYQDANAFKRYGGKARDGVVIIPLKVCDASVFLKDILFNYIPK